MRSPARWIAMRVLPSFLHQDPRPNISVLLLQGSPPRRPLPTSSGSRCPLSHCWPRPSHLRRHLRKGVRGPPSSQKLNPCPRASSRGGAQHLAAQPPATSAQATMTTASHAQHAWRTAALLAHSTPPLRAAPAGMSNTTGTSPSSPSPP